MSFDVNVLSSKPVIKAAASMQNDGGAGNLGYMYQGRQKKKDDEKNIFDLSNDIDTFGRGNSIESLDVSFSFVDFVMDVIDSILHLFRIK